jgi:alkylation response protein AidB-like acyl-CoA dehydrogenase
MRCALRKDGDAYRLTGEKSFVTLGTFARRLLVVATDGLRIDGRPKIAVVSVEARPGLSVVPLPEGPFIPEIPHAALVLEEALVAPHEILDGDGYDRYLKPFRTIEDIHVHAALLGWLLQIARRRWSQAECEQILGCAAAIGALAQIDATLPAGHIALAGAMRNVRLLLERLEERWTEVDAPTRARWERDRRLLSVAQKARAQRLEAAWRRIDRETRGHLITFGARK